MNIEPIDLGRLLPACLGILIVLIPIGGLTLRFALRPFVDAFVQARRPEPGPELAQLTQRVAELERKLQALERPHPAQAGEPPRIAQGLES